MLFNNYNESFDGEDDNGLSKLGGKDEVEATEDEAVDGDEEEEDGDADTGDDDDEDNI